MSLQRACVCVHQLTRCRVSEANGKPMSTPRTRWSTVGPRVAKAAAAAAAVHLSWPTNRRFHRSQ